MQPTATDVVWSVCVCISVVVGHKHELCKKWLKESRCRLGVWTQMGPRRVGRGNFGQYISQPSMKLFKRWQQQSGRLLSVLQQVVMDCNPYQPTIARVCHQESPP